jgi:hypothetical protein
VRQQALTQTHLLEFCEAELNLADAIRHVVEALTAHIVVSFFELSDDVALQLWRCHVAHTRERNA